MIAPRGGATLLTATMLLLLGPCSGAGSAAAPAAQASPARPSIVVFLSDDEDLASHRVMGKTKALVADHGATFANAFVSYSFCCPSRATLLRGQYPHNHRIEGNEWPTGGYEKFRAMGHEGSTVATWLDQAGYRTALFGKLMNGYEPDQHAPPPGWDEWYAVGGRFANFDYTLNENGELVAYGDKPEDHLTDVLARKAAELIRRADPAEPLFLYVAPYDPHSPATPAPRRQVR